MITKRLSQDCLKIGLRLSELKTIFIEIRDIVTMLHLKILKCEPAKMLLNPNLSINGKIIFFFQ